jgi:hypothetical protein
MQVYAWAVKEAVYGRRTFAKAVCETFATKQGQRITRMLGRVCMYAQFFDPGRVLPRDLDFREAMQLYASGEDLYEPDLDRGLVLPEILINAGCKYYPTGLLTLATYLMGEAHLIQNKRVPPYVRRNVERVDSEDKSSDPARAMCCGDVVKLPTWQVFDAVVGDYLKRKMKH